MEVIILSKFLNTGKENINFRQPFHEHNIDIANAHNVPKLLFENRILKGWAIDKAATQYPEASELAEHGIGSEVIMFNDNNIQSLDRILKEEEERRRQLYKINKRKEQEIRSDVVQSVKPSKFFRYLASKHVFPIREVR